MIDSLLALLALPQFGLSTVFVVSLISATLLPLGSELVLFGLIKLSPDLLWPAVLVATLGNTFGGAITWSMGWGMRRMINCSNSQPYGHALRWLEKLGPKACLLTWLPVIGDPLCAVAGWLRLSFWPCIFFMSVGKFIRYVLITTLLLWGFPGEF